MWIWRNVVLEKLVDVLSIEVWFSAVKLLTALHVNNNQPEKGNKIVTDYCTNDLCDSTLNHPLLLISAIYLKAELPQNFIGV